MQPSEQSLPPAQPRPDGHGLVEHRPAASAAVSAGRLVSLATALARDLARAEHRTAGHGRLGYEGGRPLGAGANGLDRRRPRGHGRGDLGGGGRWAGGRCARRDLGSGRWRRGGDDQPGGPVQRDPRIGRGHGSGDEGGGPGGRVAGALVGLGRFGPSSSMGQLPRLPGLKGDTALGRLRLGLFGEGRLLGRLGGRPAELTMVSSTVGPSHSPPDIPWLWKAKRHAPISGTCAATSAAVSRVCVS